MGAWGTAIFSDDTACDVRDEYKELIIDGMEGPAATKKVLEKWRSSLDDPDEGPIIWLALAATQWQTGRLEDYVKDKTLDIIDTGAGLELWKQEGPKLLEKRLAVLNKLKEKLLSPQPALKKIKKPFNPPIYEELKAGDVIGYRMNSGKCVMLRVAKTNKVPSLGNIPYFEMLDWIGDDYPERNILERIECAVANGNLGSLEVISILAARKKDFPVDRIKLLARGLKPCYPQSDPNIYIGWENIADFIERNIVLTTDGRLRKGLSDC